MYSNMNIKLCFSVCHVLLTSRWVSAFPLRVDFTESKRDQRYDIWATYLKMYNVRYDAEGWCASILIKESLQLYIKAAWLQGCSSNAIGHGSFKVFISFIGHLHNSQSREQSIKSNASHSILNESLCVISEGDGILQCCLNRNFGVFFGCFE